ncbi:MAG: thermonuclease family protein [Patescibacteria group bacterium]
MTKRHKLAILQILAACFLVVALNGKYFSKSEASVIVPSDEKSSSVMVASSTNEESTDLPATTTVQTNALVMRVVDGDTLIAKLDDENKEFTIRLLGVNTPETVDPRKPVECFGKEASDFAKKTLNGKRIRLDADTQADERDKYDRLLRNVFTDEGMDLNAELVRQGYAYAYLSFPLNPERKRELKLLEEDAKVNERGLWSPETCNK